MKQRSQLPLSATASILGAALLLLSRLAHAQEVTVSAERRLPAEPGDFSLKLEPGVAVPLGRPQSQLFEVGWSQTVKALFSIKPYLDIGPSVTYLSLPSENSLNAAGTAWAFGAGVQLKRPHHAPDSDEFFAMSPWVDVDLLYVRTGELNRAGFAAAVGLAVPLGAARIFWLGPFLRYMQILQGGRTGFDNRDANILSLGLSLEVGSGSRREAARVVAPVEVRTVDRETFVCPDRDKDAIPDSVDRCPDAAGSSDNYGCPAYEKLVVKKDKLELKERLYFAWDQGTLQEASFPVLDEVVKALKDNKGFRVQVEGHTSSEGTSDHNQTLSEKRAAAVRDYLISHGVEKERVVSKGFASTAPTDTNETAAGRENNRRVEFVVNFVILDEGNK